MWRRLVRCKSADIWEEHIAYIFRAYLTLYVPSACPLTFNRIYGVISQKIVLSRDRGSVNDNNGFWIRWLDLLPHSESESQSYITTDCQSASLSRYKAPIWGLRPHFWYSMTAAGLLMWGALSEERIDLSFTIAAGPRQLSHFQIRVPEDSWLYFTVSDSRVPFSSPPTTRRATVEVLDPASTRDTLEKIMCLLYTRITRGEPNRDQHLEQFVYY
jgi:hypothetical protein